MSRPQLVIVSRSIPPDPGGYQRQMTLLAPYLRRRFDRITWVGAMRSQPIIRPSSIPGVDRAIRVPAQHAPRRLRGIASLTVMTGGLIVALWAVLRRRDVRVLLLSPGLPGGVFAVRLLTRLGAQVVARYPTTGDLTERRGWAVGRSAGVRAIAPSPLQTREQSEFPVLLVPNAVAMETRGAENAEGDGIARRRRFVYVGRLIRRKRADVLLEAWTVVADLLPGWELVLVGDGGLENDSIEDEVRAQVEAGFIRRVVLTGAVADPVPLLASADVFVFPSIKEGQPNAVLEAYAVGLPVIADPHRMAEWFQPTPPLLQWAGDPDGLGEAMRCAADRTDLVELGAEGRAFVQEHHRPERTARLMADALGLL